MALRVAGLRPVQIWVPDTRLPGFAAECKRQSGLGNVSDQANTALQELLEHDFPGSDGWVYQSK